MKPSLRISSLLVSAATLLACNDSAVEPVSSPDFAMAGAERFVEEEVYEFTGDTVQFFCVRDGEDVITEPIELWGRIRERFTVILLPSGGQHAQYQILGNNLRGIGAESGAEYKVTERSHGVTNMTTMRDGASYRSVFDVSSRELGKNMRLVYAGKYSVNANGELKVERETIKEECNL